jgi:lysophospholipase L1-like esterase
VWNERVGEPRAEVLNLGFPGTNFSRPVRDLPRLLETFRPDFTIIMVGVNDFWTLPFPTENSEPSRQSFLKRHSKR